MFFQKINIASPIWNLEGIEIPEPGNRLYERHFRNVEKIVPAELLEKLESVNIFPEYVRLFVWPCNFVGKWHIDGDQHSPRHSCLNWVLKGSGLIQFNNNLEVTFGTGIHRERRSLPNDLVEAETVGHGYAINSGSIHRVITQKDGRTSISLSYKVKDVEFPVMLEKLHQINMI
jgi:hypothetical protein